MVKMIGDEVMFTTDSVPAGAELALKLAEAYGADDALGDVRVGLACGQRPEAGGRPLRAAGEPGQPHRVRRLPRIGGGVGRGARRRWPTIPRYRFRAIRPHHLRHIGRVRLFRACGPSTTSPTRSGPTRRTARCAGPRAPSRPAGVDRRPHGRQARRPGRRDRRRRHRPGRAPHHRGQVPQTRRRRRRAAPPPTTAATRDSV